MSASKNMLSCLERCPLVLDVKLMHEQVAEDEELRQKLAKFDIVGVVIACSQGPEISADEEPPLIHCQSEAIPDVLRMLSMRIME